MAMATTVKVVLGSIAFAIFWVLAVFPAVPFLPIGRTAGSLLGAMLMVIFQVITPDQAYDAIDLPILGLLFGTMVVSVYLERADMFKYLGKLLSWKCRGAKDLLCRICLISAISSAFFTNDTSCVVLTEFVLKIARQHNLPPHPFLLALASSANIGSSATPIGNPQNLVIAVQSKISFGNFLFGIILAMLMGVFINALILLCMYWKLLSVQKDEEDAAMEVVTEEDVISHRFSPATMSHLTSLNSQEWISTLESMNIHGSPSVIGNTCHVETLRNRVSASDDEIHKVPSGRFESARNWNASKEVPNDEFSQRREETAPSSKVDANSMQSSEGKEDLTPRWKRMLWKTCVYLVTIGMLVSLLMGLNMSWTAITAALALVVLDFKDARPCLEKVSYSLLIFFCGMFITVDGFNKTGIPSTVWEFMEPYAHIDHIGGIAVLAAVILVLSNIASNVPTVLLLGGRVAASAAAISAANEKKAWLILAWVSTVAGNLSLLGSAANLIVCEQAHRTPHLGYTLSFWSHLKFGVPSTLIITAIGLTLIKDLKHQKACLHGCGGHHPRRQRRKQARRVSLTHYTENLRFHLRVNLPVDQEGLKDIAVMQFQRRGVKRCQGLHSARIGRTDSGISVSAKPILAKRSKPSLFLPLPRPGCIRNKADLIDLDGDLVTDSVSSECSIGSDDPAESRQRSPLASDYENGSRTAVGSPSSMVAKDQSSVMQINSREALKPASVSLNNQASPSSPKRRPSSNHVPNLLAPHHGAFSSAPDSSISSPSRSPMRAFGTEQVINSAFWAGKPYPELSLLGSGHCSSPGSGHNSGHNSTGGDMSGQLFWQPSRGSPEYSPIPSPRMASPGPSSRIHSGAVTPLHPRAGGAATESQSSWTDDGKQQSHRLPLPPVTVSNSSLFSHSNSAATSPSVPRSPGRAENPTSPGCRWKKGKLLGRGTFGHVYVGFNSESGEMCAMKEVTLFSDDAKSKESAKQLGQEIALLSRYRHPNIVQYYGSETVDDKLYIYLEYVSGGSIYKLLQEYGKLGELAIRSYTQQILSGLAYLHAKNTVHRDIKGANILVDPNGRIKLADFGMAKHITGQSCPLSFKGSPYWMAPEVIKNSNGCNLAVDIWSLGCTVLEMTTTKPPWSQYEGVAAMFKIGNSKELPAIPDYLSDDGKNFVRQCLQRNPLHRPTAAQLLDHPFVKNAAPLERPIIGPEPSDPPVGVTNGVKSLDIGHARNVPTLDSERLAIHSSRVSKSGFNSRSLFLSLSLSHRHMYNLCIIRFNLFVDIHIPRNISCPVSPVGSPLVHPRSPQHLNGRMSPSPISSPRTTSGSSTPLTGSSGAIPFHHLNQSVYLQEGFTSMPKAPYSPYVNGPSFHSPNPDIFRGMQSGSQGFWDLVSSESDALGKQFGRPAHGELYDGQSVLAERVSQQLLRDNVKLNPSLDLRPSPLPVHTKKT
ncbi:hypothetical protein F0562_026628 [Nyssa sinensis]|uniref:mitogen-activated protein kinase kinase kinase n=1 Tax=Nyssa sinensis TaxID=561372 RepID=A0A5J5BBV6_9ASTE|nr:hypothetical protein F0562_026628 [Nyssa sinensis]